VEVFRRRCPRARIVAVELEARNADLCRANHAADPLVTVVNGAVWSAAGTVGVKDVNDGDWAYRAVPAAGSAGVRALTYAQLLAAYDLPSVDVMKMDIEGAEAEVLEASWRDIFRTTAVSIIEIHDWIEGIEARMRRIIDDATKQFDLEVSRSGEFWVVRNRALLAR
jgi:FkbM family methyltransferase